MDLLIIAGVVSLIAGVTVVAFSQAQPQRQKTWVDQVEAERLGKAKARQNSE